MQFTLSQHYLPIPCPAWLSGYLPSRRASVSLRGRAKVIKRDDLEQVEEIY